jgi:hypothetical protein
VAEAKRLQLGFFQETLLPIVKGRATTIKDEVIPLLPNLPGSYDENLHEERPLKLLFSIDHHLEEIHGEVPMYAQKLPTGLAERAAEEKMKGSFLHVIVAENAIVVISFKLVFFSF